MFLKPGDRFGRYTVDVPLGEGGMGIVYRAFDTTLERHVALKLMLDQGSADAITRDKARDLLLREARAAAGIEHVNAVAIHDVGEVDGTTYIAMELVEGESLRKRVGDGAVPIEARLRWLVDVARALDAAHARGVVHRDVKPENVMIRSDGVVKVLDFGIASRGGGAGPSASAKPGTSASGPALDTWSTSFTGAGGLQGTPRYMAPEQLRGEAFDARADQYAWGVLAYELLSGAAPWGAGAVTYTGLMDLQEHVPDPLRKVAPLVPSGVAAVVHRALEKETSLRFPSMSALLAALEPANSARRVSRVALAALAGSVLVVGVAVTAVVLRHGSTSSPIVAGASRVSTADALPARMPREDPPSFVLLLDASKGIAREGLVVSRWKDQSGNANDAVAGPGGLAPTFVEDAGHGLPALHFDGGRYMSIADAPSLQLGTEDFTIEVVARHTRLLERSLLSGYGSAIGYGLLYCKTRVDRPFRGAGLFVNFPFPEPSTRLGGQTSYDDNVISTSDGLNDGAFHLFGLRRYGATLEIRVDGVAESSVARPLDDVSAVGRPAFLGAHPEPGGVIQQLQGDIAVLVVVRYPITPKNFAALESELMARFAR